jgi:hypothetical protein
MADMTPESQHQHDEDEFRQKRKTTSFKAQLYTGLSTATFFGVLGLLVTTGVKALGAGAAAVEAAALFTNPLALGAIGVALAAGVAFTWLAQEQWTEMRVVEDEHLAKRNAECMKERTPSKSQSQEYEQNCRADGKEWAHVVKHQSQQQHAHATGVAAG